MEIWKDIPNYEGLYKVSNRGRILCCHKTIRMGISGTRVIKERIYKPYSLKGYLYFSASHQGKVKKMLVHRLVAMVFINNPENLKEVNHIDGNKENNSVENLEWITPSQNVIHSIRTGLRKSKFLLLDTHTGEKHTCLKDVSEKYGIDYKELKSKVYGNSRAKTNRIEYRFKLIQNA